MDTLFVTLKCTDAVEGVDEVKTLLLPHGVGFLRKCASM